MKRELYLIVITTIFTAALHAAPGSLSQSPLFVASPTQPNIFFMLDDSGSMDWTMPTDGLSSSSLIVLDEYDTIPDNDKEWRTWCSGANLLAYNSNITYKPWPANIPGTSTPFPDQTDLSKVPSDPLNIGSVANYQSDYGNYVIANSSNNRYNLSEAPVVQWTDNNSNGVYDNGECPTSSNDSRVTKAKNLTAEQKVNFANWFSYYRSRERTAKAAVTQVISTSSARMGMATLHHNNNVGKAISDMSDSANKQSLLTNIVKIKSSGGTPLRNGLNWVGQYFDNASTTPNNLNINTSIKPILQEVDGGACQQNFAMLMTDGQWNGGTPSNIGHQDKDLQDNFVWSAHRDATSNTLADVAMKWYKTDLATTLPNKVPTQLGDKTQNLDQNNQQHLVTFGVAFGPTGTLTNGPTDRTQAFTWPKPTSDSIETVDDLRHAAYNGRGLFLSASKPEELVASLQSVINNIESRVGSSSAVAFNMSTLSTNTLVFFAGFDTTHWTGRLDAYSVDPNTGDISANNIWSGADKLNARTNSNMINDRVIYTWGRDATNNNNGVLFNWASTNPKPKAEILADLSVNSDTSIESSPFTKSKKRLNFVRGDTTNNAVSLYRDRASRLGDIINSAPLYIDSSSQAISSREAMVYVGANDGFLHGFSASSGQELIAYAPSAVTSTLDNNGLHYLTESDYLHKYYVDGEVVSADVFIKTNSGPFASPSWRTALIGSLRGGGQGIFALDITDPNQFTNTSSGAESTVMWEFTNHDDAALGFTYSTPEIVLMNNNQWAVVTGNGYNATGTDTAQLMIIFIEKGIDGQWSAGDYIKIDTATGTSSNKNGLSTPTNIDLNDDGTIDRIYAGDILGNMWAFDVSDSDATKWKIAGDSALFSAGNTKPITMKPLVLKPETTWLSDATSNKPNLMVYFGTGQYIATGDVSNIDNQSFYGIHDTGSTVLQTALVEQKFLTAESPTTRLLTQNGVDYNSKAGWFINLTQEAGERVIVDAFELEGLIFFNTMTPSDIPCSGGGSSWLMSVDKKTGGTPTISAFDFDRNGSITSTDGYAAGIKFEYGIASKTTVLKTNTDVNYGYTSGTGANGSNLDGDLPVTKEVLPGSLAPATGERQSWIQLINN
jgi:type IV pilus assembly protein PilY1